MLRSVFLVLLFTSMRFVALGQQQTTSWLIINANFNNLIELPLKVVIEKNDLGNYGSKIETRKITGKGFSYKTQLFEPGSVTVTFYWPNKKLTSTRFWAIATTYQITIDNELKPQIVNADKSAFATKINELEKQIAESMARSVSLVKNVSYENQKIEDVEKRIDYIRDSVGNSIDEDIYKKYILTHLNLPIGLYALCKYADRPYSNQRIKSQPEQIEKLLNKLSTSIRQLPSAKILSGKLAIGKQMVVGNVFKDISLPDTAGKIFKITDFRGKFVLIDFWASWCMPCRQENPGLIRAYRKYKNAGFQIVSITRDQLSAKDDWLKAIKQDHIDLWPQLSDFNDFAQKAYAIKFIPTNYLIDPKGIIIARDLRGKALEEALVKILKKGRLYNSKSLPNDYSD